MKHRFFALLLAGLMMFGLVACGEPSSSTPIDPGTDSAPSQAAQPEASPAENPPDTDAPAATIERTVLVDRDGIVITALELTEDPVYGSGIKLLIENNSSENRIIQCDYTVVNGFMMSSMLFSANVAAGKKTNEVLSFPDGRMEAAGITAIADMSFVFCALDPDTYQRAFTTDEIDLPTSLSGSYEQPIPDQGKELCNQNGVRIVGSRVETDLFGDANIILFIENTGDTDLTIHCDDVSVNGFMVTSYLSCRVNSGRMAVSDITIPSSTLEENGIENIDTIELVFSGSDPDSYQTVFQTDPITFSTAA